VGVAGASVAESSLVPPGGVGKSAHFSQHPCASSGGSRHCRLRVSTTNIDDIIRGIIEQIYTANGFNIYNEKGGFAIWRPADWTCLLAFMQANGYSFADEALRDGGKGRIGKETNGRHL
jgi:hypothetical protein